MIESAHGVIYGKAVKAEGGAKRDFVFAFWHRQDLSQGFMERMELGLEETLV